MNPFDDYYIIDIEVVAKVSVAISVSSGTSPDAVDSIAMDTVENLDTKELIENIYDIESVSLVSVEGD
tara:strand:- start:245 stop:448 length:204 start_codon:yes stop_codon:yes gene_type:complete